MARIIKLSESVAVSLLGEAMVYQSFGLGAFDRSKFEPIRNVIGRNKPLGGLWASPDDENAFTWTKWAKSEDFMLDKYNADDRFDFTLSDNARILQISKLGDENNIPMQWDAMYEAYMSAGNDEEREKILSGCSWVMYDYKRYKDCGHRSSWLPDFEKLSRNYDAIVFEENGFTHTAMNGWDCDCILVMNPDVIIPLNDQ